MAELKASYSEDEVAEQVQAEAATDDFQDAVAEDADEGVKGEFAVTEAEVKQLQAGLAEAFPEDASYLSAAYIRSVASKPYSKDPSVRRPLDYSKEKLSHVLQWRQEHHAASMEEVLLLVQNPDNADHKKWNQAKALAGVLSNMSMYWHGLSKEGQPILWVRTNRKPWYPDVDAEMNALMVMADCGITHGMPEGVTDFLVVAESGYPPPPHPQFLTNLLQALVRGYPDRLGLLVSAPISSVVQFVVNLLLPLMPGRLAGKLVLLGQAEAQEKLEALIGADQIPDFLGGSASHEEFYPKNGTESGILKLDYQGMKERLQKARDAYQQK